MTVKPEVWDGSGLIRTGETQATEAHWMIVQIITSNYLTKLVWGEIGGLPELLERRQEHQYKPQRNLNLLYVYNAYAYKGAPEAFVLIFAF